MSATVITGKSELRRDGRWRIGLTPVPCLPPAAAEQVGADHEGSGRCQRTCPARSSRPTSPGRLPVAPVAVLGAEAVTRARGLRRGRVRPRLRGRHLLRAWQTSIDVVAAAATSVTVGLIGDADVTTASVPQSSDQRLGAERRSASAPCRHGAGRDLRAATDWEGWAILPILSRPSMVVSDLPVYRELPHSRKEEGPMSATIDNGVNVQALLDAREVLQGAPEAAQFTWRATSKWQHGVHSHGRPSTNFFGLGEEQRPQELERTFDADHPADVRRARWRHHPDRVPARRPRQLPVGRGRVGGPEPRYPAAFGGGHGGGTAMTSAGSSAPTATSATGSTTSR